MAAEASPPAPSWPQTTALAVCAVVLVWIMSIFLLPSHVEQRAIAMRDAAARAELAYAAARPRDAVTILRSSPEAARPGPAYMRALLRYLAADAEIGAHFELLHGAYRPHASPDDLRAAIGLYTRHRRPTLAIESLRDLAAKNAATPQEMLQLARALAETGDLDAAANLSRRAAHVLGAGESPRDGVFVISTLVEAGDIDGARRFAQRWLGPKANGNAVLAITPAIIEAGHADIAVDVLRPRTRSSAAAEAAYAFAVRAAAPTNADIRAELTRALLAARGRVRGAARSDLAHDLFAYGDFTTVRDALSQDGTWRQPPFRAAFIAAMRAHGQAPALRDLLVTEARTARPDGLRRTARDLADIGFPETACAILEPLAARAGPDSPALRDLMYLWHAHGISPDEAWFEARAETNSDSDAARWIQRFADATSTNRALALLARLDAAMSRRALLILRIRLLAWQGDSPALRTALRRAATTRLEATESGELFDIACAIGDAEAARVLGSDLGPPRSSAARQCLARFALDAAHAAQKRGDFPAAINAFREAATFGPLDSQHLFDFASSLERNGEPATEMFALALARLQAPSSPPSSRTETLRATLLAKLGHRRLAQETVENLLARNRDNAELLTLLAEIYVDAGQYKSALAITNARAHN